MQQLQPGQFLVKGNDKRKIYFVNEFIIGFEGGYLESEIRWMKVESLRKEGWSLLEEPWRPGDDEAYWYVTGSGEVYRTESRDWNTSPEFGHDFRLSIDNVHRTREDAELYKQKLIERMGRKS